MQQAGNAPAHLRGRLKEAPTSPTPRTVCHQLSRDKQPCLSPRHTDSHKEGGLASDFPSFQSEWCLSPFPLMQELKRVQEVTNVSW